MAASTKCNDLCRKTFSSSPGDGAMFLNPFSKGNAVALPDNHWSWWQNTTIQSDHIAYFHVCRTGKYHIEPNDIILLLDFYVKGIGEEILIICLTIIIGCDSC